MKNWKQRKINIIGPTLYYCQQDTIKGNIDLENINITTNDTQETSNLIKNNIFATLLLTSYSTTTSTSASTSTSTSTNSLNYDTLFGYKSMIDCLLYKNLFIAHTIYLSINRLTIKYPITRYGWLSKQGTLLNGWTPKFFILYLGILYYYDRDMEHHRYNPNSRSYTQPYIKKTKSNNSNKIEPNKSNNNDSNNLNDSLNTSEICRGNYVLHNVHVSKSKKEKDNENSQKYRLRISSERGALVSYCHSLLLL